MAIGNIAMEPRTVVDTQYAVHAAYDAANDAANNRSHGAGIVLTDASAMSSAIRYALSVCCSRHCQRHGADEDDVSNHVYLSFGVKARINAPERRRFRFVMLNWAMLSERPSVLIGPDRECSRQRREPSIENFRRLA